MLISNYIINQSLDLKINIKICNEQQLWNKIPNINKNKIYRRKVELNIPESTRAESKNIDTENVMNSLTHTNINGIDPHASIFTVYHDGFKYKIFLNYLFDWMLSVGMNQRWMLKNVWIFINIFKFSSP